MLLGYHNSKKIHKITKVKLLKLYLFVAKFIFSSSASSRWTKKLHFLGILPVSDTEYSMVIYTGVVVYILGDLK